MRQRAKTALKRALFRPLIDSGLPLWTHRKLMRNRLAILTYHAVWRSPPDLPDWCFLAEAAFAQQMRYLRECCEVLPLLSAVARLREGRLRGPVVALTFDDGFHNVGDVAFPILSELGLPATVFLNTGLIDTDDTVWFCRLHRALSRTGLRSLDWRYMRFDLSTPAGRATASEQLQSLLKQQEHGQLLRELDELLRVLGDDPTVPLERGSPYRMLTRAGVRAMADSGLIEFGGHTHGHAILSHLSPAHRRHELSRSIEAVRELTGRPCESFAYPNGRSEDFDADVIAELRWLGVKIAVSSVDGANEPGTPPLVLRRYGIGADLELARFQWLVHHKMGLT